VYLNAELERTLSVLRPQLPSDTSVVREYTPLPPFHCTPALLCQAFLSILENSAQSRNQGLELRLATRYEKDTILITITDNGCGIAPENLKRVFDPFFTTHEVGAGTGMGLTVAREIVVACGGDIDIESTSGNGTTVIVHLPLSTGETHVPLR
jgi:signal transduction histidine kinase